MARRALGATYWVLLAAPGLAYRAPEPNTLRRELTTHLDERERLSKKSEQDLRLSVAQRTEAQAAAGVSVTYFASDLSAPREGEPFIFTSMRRKTEGGAWHQLEADEDEEQKQGARKYRGSHRVDAFEAPKRCGFTWDDAAAKVSPPCTTNRDCHRPKFSFNTWPANATYTCFADLPDYGRSAKGECISMKPYLYTDIYCEQVCGLSRWAWCDPSKCRCQPTSQAWNLSAPIQEHDDNQKLSDLPKKKDSLVLKVRKDWKANPSGLPACRWKPEKSCMKAGKESCYKNKDKGCTRYECTEGEAAGTCSEQNWFGSSKCEISCAHVSLLNPVPYYALWIPGKSAKAYARGEREPRYEHNPKKLTIEKRGIDLHKSDVLMSSICRSNANHFVGITWFSPNYAEKAKRLVKSCERVGVCCKALTIPSDALGPEAPEGSEDFRFQIIAMKPSFILSQLDATDLPVVFLDTDLEFHRFPDLFLPGSWPHSQNVDAALFNYWGNETAKKTKDRPNIGSGVTFFNKTTRATHLLKAWAEAMAYPANARAPDDQVLDLLLVQGQWLRRATFGWLPSSYLRTMPAYYRGVIPVIDHDHGNAPGLEKHSSAKPTLPPVKDMRLSNPDDPRNQDGRPMYVPVDVANQEVIADRESDDKCKMHGQGCGPAARAAAAAKAAAAKAEAASAAGTDDIKECVSLDSTIRDAWCNKNCNNVPPQCPEDLCSCDGKAKNNAVL